MSSVQNRKLWDMGEGKGGGERGRERGDRAQVMKHEAGKGEGEQEQKMRL